jgi:hypothetical protein
LAVHALVSIPGTGKTSLMEVGTALTTSLGLSGLTSSAVAVELQVEAKRLPLHTDPHAMQASRLEGGLISVDEVPQMPENRAKGHSLMSSTFIMNSYK